MEQYGADMAPGLSTAGRLEVGYDPYPGKSGNVAFQNDQDAFKVDLEAGKSYRIETKGNERTDYGGTAPDPEVTIISRDGNISNNTTEFVQLNTPIDDDNYSVSGGTAARATTPVSTSE